MKLKQYIYLVIIFSVISPLFASPDFMTGKDSQSIQAPVREEYCISHILCKTKEEAKDILSELQNTNQDVESSFEELVLLKSIDESTKNNKGFLGCVKANDLSEDLLEMIKVTEPGHVVGKVIAIFDRGYSVILVHEEPKLLS